MEGVGWVPRPSPLAPLDHALPTSQHCPPAPTNQPATHPGSHVQLQQVRRQGHGARSPPQGGRDGGGRADSADRGRRVEGGGGLRQAGQAGGQGVGLEGRKGGGRSGRPVAGRCGGGSARPGPRPPAPSPDARPRASAGSRYSARRCGCPASGSSRTRRGGPAAGAAAAGRPSWAVGAPPPAPGAPPEVGAREWRA